MSSSKLTKSKSQVKLKKTKKTEIDVPKSCRAQIKKMLGIDDGGAPSQANNGTLQQDLFREAQAQVMAGVAGGPANDAEKEEDGRKADHIMTIKIVVHHIHNDKVDEYLVYFLQLVALLLVLALFLYCFALVPKILVGKHRRTASTRTFRYVILV